MIIENIPSTQIVKTAARRNKDYELEFINTDTNSDRYALSIFLRRHNQDDNQNYKIRLSLISSILAYPALKISWQFDEEQYELASRVYHRICDEVDDVKTDFDKSMCPGSTLAAKVKEAVKPISLSHQEKGNSVALNASANVAGVSDWRKSIYSGRYPNTSQQEKQQFWAEQTDQPATRRTYKTREKY